MLFKVEGDKKLALVEVAAYGYRPEWPDHQVSHQRPQIQTVGLVRNGDGSLSVNGAPPTLSGAPVLGLDRISDGQVRFLVIGMVGSVHASADRELQVLPFTPSSIIRAAAAERFRRLSAPDS
jgi:hypothetical protein